MWTVGVCLDECVRGGYFQVQFLYVFVVKPGVIWTVYVCVYVGVFGFWSALIQVTAFSSRNNVIRPHETILASTKDESWVNEMGV